MDSEQFSVGQSQTVVGTCVKCSGLVRIPLTANPRAVVRCPRCQETFPLGEILEKAAPSLEVVEQSPPRHAEPGSEIPEAEVGTYNPENGRFEVPAIIQRNTKFKRRRRKEKEKHPLHDETWKKRSAREAAEPEDRQPGGPTEGVAIDDPEAAPSTKSRTGPAAANKNSAPREREYNRRRQRADLARQRALAQQSGKNRRTPARSKPAPPSPATEMVKVVAGGLLAIPVAQLLIWWVVGSDPLGIAPTVSRSMPFVVPAKYHADEDPALSPLGTEADPATDSSTTNRP